MRAVIVIDMLEDFVHGSLANPQAAGILEPLGQLLVHARGQGWVVAFANDAHEPDDPELRVWGPHALRGSPGAAVVSELAPRPSDLIVPKRVYGAFDGTGLAEALARHEVDEVVLTGQHTHICVRHTAYGALRHGLGILVPRDAVCAFEGVDEAAALDYLVAVYGARLTTVAELTALTGEG
jgi:nicotinamidase-related amidase